MVDLERDGTASHGHYCSFEQQQVIWFFGNTFHMPLEMPHIHHLISRIKSLIFLVRQKILSQVQNQFFTLIADEVTDC